MEEATLLYASPHRITRFNRDPIIRLGITAVYIYIYSIVLTPCSDDVKRVNLWTDIVRLRTPHKTSPNIYIYYTRRI